MKNKIYVYSKADFKEHYQEHLDTAVFISIEATEECAKYWLEVEKKDFDNEHILPDGPHVLNLNFDDITDPVEHEGHTFEPMSFDDAVRVIDFIDSNPGLDVVIHCKAGMSRSQGVASGILDNYKDLYEGARVNPDNENRKCRRLIGMAYWVRNWSYENDTNYGLIRIDCATYFGKTTPNGSYLIGAVDCEEDYYWVRYSMKDKKLEYTSCCGDPLQTYSNDRVWGDIPPLNVDFEALGKIVQEEGEKDARYFMEHYGYPLNHSAVKEYIEKDRLVWWPSKK